MRSRLLFKSKLPKIDKAIQLPVAVDDHSIGCADIEQVNVIVAPGQAGLRIELEDQVIVACGHVHKRPITDSGVVVAGISSPTRPAAQTKSGQH